MGWATAIDTPGLRSATAKPSAAVLEPKTRRAEVWGWALEQAVEIEHRSALTRLALPVYVPKAEQAAAQNLREQRRG